MALDILVPQLLDVTCIYRGKIVKEFQPQVGGVAKTEALG